MSAPSLHLRPRLTALLALALLCLVASAAHARTVSVSVRNDFFGPQAVTIEPHSEALVQVTGTVKWFDATRGFGFLVSEEAEGDILIHFSVLKEHDRRSLPEGATVECLVVQQERGK